jgi:hypothetical protein
MYKPSSQVKRTPSFFKVHDGRHIMPMAPIKRGGGDYVRYKTLRPELRKKQGPATCKQQDTTTRKQHVFKQQDRNGMGVGSGWKRPPIRGVAVRRRASGRTARPASRTKLGGEGAREHNAQRRHAHADVGEAPRALFTVRTSVPPACTTIKPRFAARNINFSQLAVRTSVTPAPSGLQQGQTGQRRCGF